MKDLMKYMLVAAAFAVASCSRSQTDDPTPPKKVVPGEKVEVTFTTSVRTRVQREEVVTTLGTGDVLSLYTAPVTATAAYSHARADCSDGVWRCTPSLLLAPEEEVSLLAAYPRQSGADDPEAFPVRVAAQTDYLYSGAPVRVSYDKPAAALTLRHALCIVAFNIRSQISGELRQIVVDSDRFPLEGTLSVSSGQISVVRSGSYTYTCQKPLSEQGWTTGHPGFFAIPHAAESYRVTLGVGDERFDVSLPATEFTAGKKYIFQVVLTERGAVLLPEQTEIVTLDADTDPLPDATFGVVGITHTKRRFGAPTFDGASPYGYVYWGDQSSDPYAAEITHDYAGDGPYTIACETWGAEQVRFADLEGIERIDLSEF